MRGIGLWLAGGFAGSLLFWVIQVWAGSGTITAYMGQEIVAAGRYPPPAAPFIGWAVHLEVSLAYAGLVAVLLWLLRSAPEPARMTVGLAASVILGWITALIAPPAISVTVSLLGRQGWPVELFPLNTEFGLPFWNHLAFFILNWLVHTVGAPSRP